MSPISVACQGYSIQALNMFEGTRLTQLLQVVTAGRLFLIHKGQVDPQMDECLYHKCKLWSQRILTPSKPLNYCYGLRVEGDWMICRGYSEYYLTCP